VHYYCSECASPCGDKSDDVKDSCWELWYVVDEFPRYRLKILFGDFSAEVGREDVFKPAFGNERVHLKLVMTVELEF
jgi:hypothetical protein